MTPPIRASVHTLVEFAKEPAEMTMREALEWFKRIVRELQDDGMIRPLEQKYMNERWAQLCDGIAKREGLPTGSLSYYLGELAHAEINLDEVGEAEATAAKMYT